MGKLPFIKHHSLLLLSVFFLLVIPFFWLKPGEMDLGGDSSRLYFYDPLAYLTSFPLYSIVPNGIGGETIGFYLIPYVLFLALLKTIIVSPYLLITLFNSMTLVVAFLSIVGIIKLLLRSEDARRNVLVEYAAILAGFFYTLSPFLTRVGWDKALFNHNQVFLNPLLFFLMLSFLLTNKSLYVVIALLITFIFAPSFSPSPYFFSFFPLAIVYLFLFAIVVKSIRVVFKKIALIVMLFLLMHLFHLAPFVSTLFTKGTSLYESTFTTSGIVDRGLGYFLAVAQSTMYANNLFGLSQERALWARLDPIWIIFPILIAFGLYIGRVYNFFSKEQRYNFLLLTIFFLITLFLATAKITHTGFELYKSFFQIPGFGMFRNYLGQFAHVFIFFYALVLGFSLFSIFSLLKKHKESLGFFLLLLVLIFWTSFSFIRGDMINTVLNKGSAREVKIPIRMDPEYEKVLAYIQTDPRDAKYFLFPLDDPGYQMLSGKDGGAYQGPPTIPYLTGKSTFSGAAGKFGEAILHFSRNKDFESINNALSLLGIRYIFHNSDPRIYDETFQGYPYAFARKFMPLSQDLYEDFIPLLAVAKKQTFGDFYHRYELNPKYYLPHIFVAKKEYYINSDTDESYVLPFSFGQDDRRIAIYSRQDERLKDLAQYDSLFLFFKKDSSLFNAYTKKSDSLIVGTSTTPQLYGFLHPFLVATEKTANEAKNREQRVYFDEGVYKLEKLIAEGLLDAYKKQVFALTDSIREKKALLYSSLVDQIRLIGIVRRHEHAALNTSARNTFQDIYAYLGVESSSQINATYTVDVPLPGSYELYVDKTVFQEGDLAKIATVSSTQDRGRWRQLSTYIIEKERQFRFSIPIPQYLPGMDSIFIQSLDERAKIPYTVNLRTQSTMLSFIQANMTELTDWKPNTTYLASFEYKVVNPNFGESLWRPYKAIIETNDTLSDGLMLLLNDPGNPQERIDQFYQGSDIEMRNISFIAVPYPKVVFRKDNMLGEKKIPHITFTKINPTKYEVAVRGATDPYTLVFLEGFSEKWKAYIKKEDPSDKEIIESYSNGEVREGRHRNAFFEGSIFETWGRSPIAERAHNKVNGYANAWHITPEDTDGLTDYTLVIEFTGQRMVYPLLFISFSTFVGSFLWVGILLVKKIDKRRKDGVRV